MDEDRFSLRGRVALAFLVDALGGGSGDARAIPGAESMTDSDLVHGLVAVSAMLLERLAEVGQPTDLMIATMTAAFATAAE